MDESMCPYKCREQCRENGNIETFNCDNGKRYLCCDFYWTKNFRERVIDTRRRIEVLKKRT